MKKFLVILLSLGLLVAFGATASALDVKFGGSYYVVGIYNNNYRVADENAAYSRAYFYTRTRIQPEFVVAEGLTLVTRFDALEKQWGQTDWRGGFDDKNSSRREVTGVGVRTATTANAYNSTTLYGTNPKIQESIEFERAYVVFKTAVGVVQVGSMSSGKWGTDFGDDEQSRFRARIDTAIGPLQMGFVYEKEYESDYSSIPVLNTATGAVTYPYQGKADADNDTYAPYVLYNFKGGSVGLLYKYFDRRAPRVLSNYRAKFHALLPVVKATIGPVYFEAEAFYAFGKAVAFDSGASDIDIDGLGAYGKVRMNLGPVYFGAMALYSQGDDGSDPTKVKMGPQSQDLFVGLLLGNDELQTYTNSSGNGSGPAGGTNVNGVTPYDSGKANTIMYSAFVGANPTPKLNVEMIAVSASKDKIASSYVSKNLGIELDVIAKYKIFDNLTYMVGAGYLWTGDYFKGTNSANLIGNDYILLNRLSLSF